MEAVGQPRVGAVPGEPPHATEAPDEALNLLKALQRQQEEQLMAAEKAVVLVLLALAMKKHGFKNSVLFRRQGYG